ncbi:hypothetical protein DXP75_06915 [Listeria monocytogenes]|nr:hypothetical protein [Listeria monocytogenes]
MDHLTNDAKFLLSSMYGKYLEKRTSGETKKVSMLFGDVDDIHSEIMPEWLFDDVLTTCLELERHGFIKSIHASNKMLRVSISTEAIALQETTFKDKIDLAFEYAGKIKNSIPFF